MAKVLLTLKQVSHDRRVLDARCLPTSRYGIELICTIPTKFSLVRLVFTDKRRLEGFEGLVNG